MSSEPAGKYSNCRNYFTVASGAIEEMVRQIKEIKFDERGIMQKGVIVRHLTLPGYLEDSKRIIKYLYENYGVCFVNRKCIKMTRKVQHPDNPILLI